MYSVRPNLLIRKLYPSAIWRIPAKEKKIFLTFDDGPVPEITPWVLSTLKQFNAQATFFCIGANIEKHPEVFRQIIAEGHAVGNHTYNHLNGWKTKTKDYLDNVEKCKTAMYNGKCLMANGHQPSTINHQPLFRPPYGRMKRSQYLILKAPSDSPEGGESACANPPFGGIKGGFNSQFSIIMWDVLSGDFDQKLSKEKCLKNVLTYTREGSIVVFHDSVKAKEKLFYVLPKALEHFGEKGFEFQRLSL